MASCNIRNNTRKNENIKEKYESCIWETDADGKLVKLGDTSDYTGIYNGRVYKNSTILTDTVIAVDKGTNIETMIIKLLVMKK